MTEDYCEMCDLPLSTCVHGMPPPPPPVEVAKVSRAEPRPRARTVREQPVKAPVPRKWTPSEAFRPHILAILDDNDGRLDSEDLMLELEVRMDEVLTPGDRETSPQGGLRWQIATRKERKALIDEGLLVPASPGMWELTDLGRAADGS